MLAFPDIDPVAFRIGTFKIHWYGIMYLVAFAGGWGLGRVRARDSWRGWRAADVDDALFSIALGVILGGRLGYVLFYDLGGFLANPASIFQVWQGGMSFHGGLLGVIVAMWWFGRSRGRSFFEVSDFIAPLVPVGILAGRIGNFINGELWGKPSDVPWAMVFPRAGEQPRHPSQLYEAALEGLALFVVLWVFSRRPRPTMAVSGLFLAGYGVARSAVELVRVPDADLGYLALGWITMGQILSAPMIVLGVVLLGLSMRCPVEIAAAGAEVAPEPAPRGRKRGRRRKRK